MFLLLALLGVALAVVLPAQQAMAATQKFDSGQQTFTSTGEITIPETGIAAPYPSTANVSGLTGNITDVDVTLNGLSHTYPNDLDMLLVAPGGQKSVIMSDAGGSFDITDADLTFDDEAAAALPDTDNDPIAPGTYKPTDYSGSDNYPPPVPTGPHAASLSQFDGTDPNGEWRLFVRDEFAPDGGGISSFSVTITTESAENIECADSIDNDGDGRTDFGGANGDFGCDNAIDDSENTDRLSIRDESADEGDSGTTPMTFSVSLANPLTQPVTVDYATSDRTATDASDYAATNGALNFAPGETTKQITIAVTGDTKAEPDESFKVVLSNAQNSAVERTRATGTIDNDDENASPTADDDSYETPEGKVLRVPAPGILDGDGDADAADTLTAAKASGPAHGILSLESDGSFAYRPDDGFVGQDSFTYKASDGASQSNAATVSITVEDATAPTVTSVSPIGVKVSPAANATATFSEAMNRSTLTASTVKLTKGPARVAAQLTVSPDGKRTILNPNRNLTRGATYTATITTGAKDASGNALKANKTWRFKVRR